MFQGSIPPAAQSFVVDEVAKWDCDSIYVGCSGNLTIERCLFDAGQSLALHSNDVNIYSVAIGSYFAGSPIKLRLSEHGKELAPWLEPFLEEDSGALASLMLMSNLAMGLGRDNAARSGSSAQKSAIQSMSPT